MPVVYIREDTPLPERARNDYYETDRDTCTTALIALKERLGVLPVLALDPGAGRGPWGCAYQHLQPAALIDGVESDTRLVRPPWYDTWSHEDFLASEPALFQWPLIFGNPPYNQAEKFVRKAMELVAPRGHVYFLLKLSFLAGQRRRDRLYKEFPLKECLILSKRPSFQENLKTAPDEYAMFLWQRGYEGPTRVSHL